MKFVSSILFISTSLPYALCGVVAGPKPLRFQHPEDVGAGHTEVMQDIHQRMRENPPLDTENYIIHMIDAVVEYMCKPITEQCVKNILSTTNNIDLSYSNGFEHLSENLLSKDFDANVLEYLEDLFFSIGLLDWDESPEDILNVMYKNFEDLKNNHEVKNENHRSIGLIAYSVGMESAKQWHEVLNDPNNEFHKFIYQGQDQRRRNLQAELLGGLLETANENANLDSTRLIEADVIGGASGAIVVGFDRFRGIETTNTAIEDAFAKATSTAVIFSTTNVVLQTGILGGNSNGTGILGGIFGGNGTGILGGIFGGNNTNNETGIFGGIFSGIGGNNENNGTGVLGGILGGIGGNNENNDTGILGGILGGIGGNNENNDTGILSGILGGIGGNNGNQENSTDENQDEGGGIFSGLIGGLTGNTNNANQDSENNTTNGDGGDTSGTNNQPGTSSNADDTTAAATTTGAGAVISNALGGFINNADEPVATASTVAETAETVGGATNTASNALGIVAGFLGGNNNGNR